MQFGVMAMQLDWLMPSTAGDVATHIAQFDQAVLVERIAMQGFDLVELGGDLSLFFPHTFEPETVERLRALKQRGLRYTVHLPLWSVEPSTLQNPVRRGSVEALIACIRSTAPLEPEMYVLHATGALAAEFYRMQIPELARGLILRQFQRNASDSISEILGATGLPSRKLAIETIEFPFDLTLELAEAHDCSICFDTGHVLVGFSGPIELFDALERALPRLGEIHLHDGPWQGLGQTIGYGKDHQPLGQGDLDVGRLIDRLAQAQFEGPIIFELGVGQALASLEHIRSLRPEALGE